MQARVNPRSRNSAVEKPPAARLTPPGGPGQRGLFAQPEYYYWAKTMDPEIQEHAKRHPRLYACMLLAMAVAFGLGGVRAQNFGWYGIAVTSMSGGIFFFILAALF